MSTKLRKARKRARQVLLEESRWFAARGYHALSGYVLAEAESYRFSRPAKVGTPVALRARYRDPAAEVDAELRRGAMLARLFAPLVRGRR